MGRAAHHRRGVGALASARRRRSAGAALDARTARLLRTIDLPPAARRARSMGRNLVQADRRPRIPTRRRPSKRSCVLPALPALAEGRSRNGSSARRRRHRAFESSVSRGAPGLRRLRTGRRRSVGSAARDDPARGLPDELRVLDGLPREPAPARIRGGGVARASAAGGRLRGCRCARGARAAGRRAPRPAERRGRRSALAGRRRGRTRTRPGGGTRCTRRSHVISPLSRLGPARPPGVDAGAARVGQVIPRQRRLPCTHTRGARARAAGVGGSGHRLLPSDPRAARGRVAARGPADVDRALRSPRDRPTVARVVRIRRTLRVGRAPGVLGSRVARSRPSRVRSARRRIERAPPCCDTHPAARVPIAPVRATVCLPTYNERENLESMVRALGDKNVHVLVVDDNSPDGTGAIADRLASELDYVGVLHRDRKYGLGPAYLAGIQRALAGGAQLVLEMDCDFSHAPDDVPRLIAAADGGADLALGSRYVNGGSIANWGAVRRLVSAGGSLYARLLLGAP